MPLFKTTILTPEARTFDGQVDSLLVPGGGGLFGVLAGHAPMVATLAAGVLHVKTGTDTAFYAVGSGIIEVGRQGTAILADFAIRATSESDASQKLAERTGLKPTAAVTAGH